MYKNLTKYIHMNSGRMEVADVDFLEAYPNSEVFVKFSDLAALPSASDNMTQAAMALLLDIRGELDIFKQKVYIVKINKFLNSVAKQQSAVR